MRGHVAIITETESTYVMIESTLRFDDVEDVPGLQPLLRAVQRSRMWSRTRSGRRPGNEAKYSIVSFSHTHVVSKRGVVLFVAATACTRVTTGYSIDLHFFFSDLSPPLSEGDKGKKKLPYCLPFYSPIHVLL